MKFLKEELCRLDEWRAEYRDLTTQAIRVMPEMGGPAFHVQQALTIEAATQERQ